MAFVAEELAERARAEVVATGLRTPPEHPPAGRPPVEEVAAAIARFLVSVVTRHADEVRARYAMALEVGADPDLRERLAASTFSLSSAERLMASLRASDVPVAARGLVSLCEGVVLEHVLGRDAHEPPNATEVAAQVATYLRGTSADSA